MCGITGFWTANPGLRGEGTRALVLRMAEAIAHRGPDADGAWVSQEDGLALGHRRLSIIDLSAAGAQPMLSARERFAIVYNGEIYNHLEIRADLEAAGQAPAWRGHSDTETLLAAIEVWGVEKALRHACGMFTFALWDRNERALYLARDRIGEKPLYYGWCGQSLIFGSELKALRAFPGFDNTVDSQAVAEFLRYAYVPAPLSIYRNVRKLPAGSFLRISAIAPDVRPQPQTYWSLTQAVSAGAPGREREYSPELAAETEAVLKSVVASQMLSDVPLGSFLSGGVDSSLITALMQASAAGPVRTYSIGFEDPRFNEAPYAREVARHLGTSHTEMIVTEADCLALIPSLATIYDEPFADSSQIPTTLLARMTRQHVTVALSGDGGDEFYGGYNRYLFVPDLWRYLAPLPGPVRRALGALLALAGPTGGSGAAAMLGAAANRMGLPRTALDRLAHIGAVIGHARAMDDVYSGFASIWPEGANCPSVDRPQGQGHYRAVLDTLNLSAAGRMMVMDAITYLPDDIMVKVDRAAMSASLESRAPFLDVRAVEQAWRLPQSAKIRGRTGKVILRDILYRHVPREMIERPKQGFSIPLDSWLRGALKDWAAELLGPQALAASGLLRPEPVLRAWQAHSAGRINAGSRLWAVLMLQSWLREQST